jgi:primosomal protein N' (replication factor Y)
VQAAAAQEYAPFYEQEVALRREHLYPPFSRLARLLFEHTNEAYAEKQAQELARGLRERLRRQGLGEVDVIGPAPAYVARLRGRWRWHLVLRVPYTVAVELPGLLASLALPSGWRVDVDPMSVL